MPFGKKLLCMIADKTATDRSGSRIPRRRGCQHTNLPDFPKNCMKLRKFWSVGEAPGTPPLDPPLTDHNSRSSLISNFHGGGRGEKNHGLIKPTFISTNMQGVKCPTFSYFLGFILLFPTFR